MKRLSIGGLAATALLALLITPARLIAQANVTTANIEGIARDGDGNSLPGVGIEGVNAETSLRRGSTTDSGGRYLLTFLPPGRYAVTARLQGFATATRSGLTLTLGSSARVDFTLRLANVSEAVTVTGEAPIIESTETGVTATVDRTSIANLPLKTRDWRELVLLTPGATDDGGPEGRVHLSGQRGINNSFNVDGADSNSSFFGEQRGGTRPPFTFSQGAIQEFQVIASTYNAQYGNASGGIINAVTRSGTNDVHAEVFGFYRSHALQQTDANNFRSDSFEQKQFGGFVGGPLMKDRLFFFGGYDGQRLKDPFQAVYDNRGTPLDPLLVPANLAKLQSYGIDPNTEWSTVTQTNDVDSPFGKLTLNASDKLTVSIRDNYNKQKGANLTSGRNFPNTGISNNGLERNFFNSFVANANYAGSGWFFDELIFQAATEHRPRLQNPTVLPETIISQFGRFGQNNFLPNNLDETRIQFTDNATFYRGAHTFKAGADFSHVKYSDEFFRYRFGVYNFSSFANFVAGKPSAYRQAFSNYGGLVDYSQNLFSVYVQDEWRPSSRVTVNLGVRYDLQSQPDSVDVNPLYPDVQTIPTDKNNVAPRFGIAWDHDGDGSGVLRGGVGIFYANTPSLLTANSLLNNGVRVLDYNISCPSSVCPAGVPSYPNILTSPGSLKASTLNLFVFDRSFQNTQTTRFSIGYDRAITRDLAVGAQFIYAHTAFGERVRDANIVAVGVLPDGRARYSTSARPNKNYGAIQTFMSDGHGNYDGFILSMRKRFSHGFMVNASYTYGVSKDDQSNERSVSQSGNTPEDSYNLPADYSSSDFDVRHAVVISGIVELPFGIRLAPVYRWRTGVPWTAGNSIDANGDGVFNDRANDLVNCVQGATSLQCDLGPNHQPRNGQRQQRQQYLDATLSKEFASMFQSGVGITLYVQGFNLTNSSNRTVTSGNQNQIVSAGTVSGVQKYQYNANFGIYSVVGLPRQFQLGVRVNY
jgi:hypothetical protein